MASPTSRGASSCRKTRTIDDDLLLVRPGAAKYPLSADQEADRDGFEAVRV
jgi:hypothetical protein